MSGIIDQAIAGAEGLAEGAEEAAEAVAGDAEAFLLPRPGGKIDTARRHHQDPSGAAEDEGGRTQEERRGRPVGTDALLAEIGMARTVTLGVSNPALPILPRDLTRRDAVILAVDNDVYLSNDPGQVMTAVATGGATATGVFYLPAKIAIHWNTTDQLWAGATTTASTSRISVLTALKGY
jgi:hypothetical protein